MSNQYNADDPRTPITNYEGLIITPQTSAPSTPVLDQQLSSPVSPITPITPPSSSASRFKKKLTSLNCTINSSLNFIRLKDNRIPSDSSTSTRASELWQDDYTEPPSPLAHKNVGRDPHCSDLVGSSSQSIAYTLASLNISESPSEAELTAIEDEAPEEPQITAHRALYVPEILHKIISYLDDLNQIPFETPPRRRKPMSLQHAILIYGDTPRAREAWERAQAQKSTGIVEGGNGIGLANCLTVSVFWYNVTMQVLYQKLHFKRQNLWNKFVQQYEMCDIQGYKRPNPSVLVLHKLTQACQDDIDIISPLGGNLKWLEFYTCPDIVPTESLLAGGQLIKLVLPGCTLVDDDSLHLISLHCPQLQYLDLRACELVSDKGLRVVARRCRQLKLLNVGRTSNGHLVTSKGLRSIAKYTDINTVGVAGCHIDDAAIWAFAKYRGNAIERLSLNNCFKLTDDSIPRMLGYLMNLSVLELRGCLQITDMRPIIMFKRILEKQGRPPLIEGCEVFETRMKEAEWALEMEKCSQIFRDCLHWIYSPDDDRPYVNQHIV